MGQFGSVSEACEPPGRRFVRLGQAWSQAANHLLVADATGRSAVIKFALDRRTGVFGATAGYLVLTNFAYQTGFDYMARNCRRSREATQIAEAGSTATVRDRFSAAYLVAVAARVAQDVGELGARADKAGRRLSTLTVETEVRFASAEARTGFAEELARAVARLTDKYHDAKTAGGRAFRFVVAGYPATPPKE